MSDAPLPTGHPQRHGYAQCARCGTWRKPGHTQQLPSLGGAITVCLEVNFCSEQAKATGRLEGP